MRYSLIIIGTGNLGKKHLTSILNSDLELDIHCFDINTTALNDFEWNNKYNNKRLKQISSFEELPEIVDFALFAMVSKGRREMFDLLTKKRTIKNILFEKVLFQRIDDYEHVGNRLRELNINAWVNCARRQMDSYQSLKERLKSAKEMRISISGGEWGLACNAIHEIDLIEFLSEANSTFVNKLDLLPLIVESKRPGFKEVYGTISGISGRCTNFSINCMKDNNVPDILTIFTDIGQFIIYEGKRKMISMAKENGYELKEETFDIPYQSQMTQLVLEDILLRGTSRLVEYDESARLHLQFMKPLMKFFHENGLGDAVCPIT